MTPFLERIQEEPLVCFGALGTMVMDKGFNLADCLGQWLLDHPDEHRWLTGQYVEAGCKLLGSAGSQGCRWRLEKWGLEDRVVEMNREVTKVVKAAAPEGSYVAGIVMHCGRMLKPMGDLEPEDLSDAFREEFVGYAEGGADVLWIATIMDMEEAVIAVRTARDVCDLPVIASMSFDFGAKGARTMMGVDPKTAAIRLAEAGADVVGHNCGGASPAESTRILREMGEVTDKPLAVKPNGGEPKVVDGRTTWPFTPEQYAAETPNWVAAGARVVGGCCGTTPQHAASMYAALRQGD